MVAPPTVWLVDDDDDDLMLLESAFKRVDASVQLETMHDGEDLVARLQSDPERPSFVVLDLNMDRLSGMHALQEIRQKFPQRELKVIVLTTSFNPDDRFRSEVMGANDFFVKPTEFSELIELVRGMLQQWVS
ncbi:MAG: response regulator [Cytophagales bacterium]|nr:MAG: response regulator [Cytophagales bacterium]